MPTYFNVENRNENIIVRRCSFCRRPGHNITRCNSETINRFESEILDFIQLLVSQGEESIRNLENLRHYLLNKTLEEPNLVRAFAISRCGAHSRSNMDSCIFIIIQHFRMHLIQNTETNNEIIQDNNENIQQDTGERQSDQLSNQRWRQFEFSEMGIDQLSENNHNLYMMFHDIIRFIEIIRSISESSELNRKFHIKTKISENQDDLEEKCECNICYEEHEKKLFVKLDCGHEFCKDCIKKSLQNERRENPCCAFCRGDIKNFELKLESIKNEFKNLIIPEYQL